MNRINMLAVAVIAALVATSGVASGQSLAEFARQERARKSGAPEARVITNEALRRTDSGAPNATAPVTSPKPPADSASSAEKSDKKDDKKDDKAVVKDEKWWREAFAKAREDATRADAQVRVLEIQLTDANKDLLIRDDVFNKEGQMIPKINSLNADLEAARRRAAEARQKITDLEDELRKSGGLPGWAR